MRSRILQNYLFVSAIALGWSPAGLRAQNNATITIRGKVVDAKRGNMLDGAVIHVVSVMRDSIQQGYSKKLISNTYALDSGYFTVDIPAVDSVIIYFSANGYMGKEKSLGLSADKVSLGLIPLSKDSSSLDEVVVTSSGKKPYFQMDIDKKVFNVDQDITSSGQTAEEVMRNIPSLSVDIDGNLTMRNTTPTVFVDGLPTTLTLDQIPSDMIEKVELISNPSAKYDASGGGAGIVNIVLKENKRFGYNGGVRSGVDSRGGLRAGGDLSVRQGKINFFVRGMYRKRKGSGTNDLERNTISNYGILQHSKNTNGGNFGVINVGVDYDFDDANRLSLSGRYFNGSRNFNQPQSVDSLYDGSLLSSYEVLGISDNRFKSYNGKFNYVHKFNGSGHQIITNAEYENSPNSAFNSVFVQQKANYVSTSVLAPNILQYTNTVGRNRMFTFQSDYTNPLSANTKLEAGVRAAITKFANTSLVRSDSTGVGEAAMLFRGLISNKYRFTNNVYAAYATFTSKWGEKLSYQIGARVESSNYLGTNTLLSSKGVDSTSSNFTVKYPLNLFPSAFVTYKLSDQEDLQLNYTRKINRPTFFQLIPSYNYRDPYNIRVGNPDLSPEFANNFEVSYNNKYSKTGNFLATAYWRHNSNLITSIQYRTLSPLNGVDSVLMNSYVNARSSNTYGLELINTIKPISFWNMTSNLNLFNTKINGGAATGNLTNQRWSWLAKLNNEFDLKSGWTLQVSGQYQSKSMLPNTSSQNQNNGRSGGFSYTPVGSVQGYLRQRWTVDAAVKKTWKFDQGNTLDLSAAISDIFKTNYFGSYSETAYMSQLTKRMFNPRMITINASWRFSKFSKSLFSHKSSSTDEESKIEEERNKENS